MGDRLLVMGDNHGDTESLDRVLADTEGETFDLAVGREIPEDGRITAGGLQFTNSPDHVATDVILVTHMETWSLVDHFGGRAHFCGNTHRGRHRGRRLNAASVIDTGSAGSSSSRRAGAACTAGTSAS